MPLKHPIDFNGKQMIVGWQGSSSSIEYGPNNVPFTTEFATLVPISGTDFYELYVHSPIHTGSLTGSSGFVIYGSGSDGKLYPIGAVEAEDGSGQYALKTDTELILSGNIVVSNVRVFSTDGTSASLVYGRAQASTNYPFAIPVDVSGNFLQITPDGRAAFVTSSHDMPVYSSLVAYSGSAYYTASIDQYNDLHVYDWRVSASISSSNDLLTQVSGAIVENTDAVYEVSGSVVGTYEYLTNISGTNIQVSGAIVENTDAVYEVSGSVVGTYEYLTNISSSISSSNDYLSLISSSLSESNHTLIDIYDACDDSNTLLSQSNIYASMSDDHQKFAIIMSMFKYQLGVDAGSYNNTAGGTTVNIYGTTAITGSTICPYVYNATNLTSHYVNLSTVTTSSFTVSPAITTATASLIIKYNAPENAYNQLASAYDTNLLNPDRSSYTNSQLVSESNGALGLTTSSDFPVINYRYFNMQFSRLLNVTASVSATLNTDASPPAVDWEDITYSLYGAYLITGSCILERDTPMKYAQLRVNYYKSNASNGSLIKYTLFN